MLMYHTVLHILALQSLSMHWIIQFIYPTVFHKLQTLSLRMTSCDESAYFIQANINISIFYPSKGNIENLREVIRIENNRKLKQDSSNQLEKRKEHLFTKKVRLNSLWRVETTVEEPTNQIEPINMCLYNAKLRTISQGKAIEKFESKQRGAMPY